MGGVLLLLIKFAKLYAKAGFILKTDAQKTG
jgi:hypothetical protein